MTAVVTARILKGKHNDKKELVVNELVVTARILKGKHNPETIS